MPINVRELLAEFLGTLVLVFFAVGSAVFGITVIGALGVAVAFGSSCWPSHTPSGPCPAATSTRRSPSAS